MKWNRKLLIIGVLLLLLNMAIATQFALTKAEYKYLIVQPCDESIRYIGSDNSSDGIRVLRVQGNNDTNVQLILCLGDTLTTNMEMTYSAAFGIVNEEQVDVRITYINVSSLNNTYLKIWLHGDRDANANSMVTDPSTVYMYNNGTVVNASDTTAWTLAAGDGDASTMCSNFSARDNCNIDTPWDETAHVRYSCNETNAVSGFSDFVWVQISVEIPAVIDSLGAHTGTIWIHLESEADL